MWILIAISAYFIFAVVSLVDKHLLAKSIPNPKVYTFYVGVLGILAVVISPFVGFYVPGIYQILLGFLTGTFFVFSLFWLYKGLSLFEASRIIPAIGGLVPLFTFGLIYVFSGGKVSLSAVEIIAFLLLILGSTLIASEKGKFVDRKSLRIVIIAAFFLALYFAFAKYLYLALPFWTGFIWRSIGSFLSALFFLIIFPEIKKEIFRKRERMSHKTTFIFLSNQAGGAAAAILQNWAVALAPLSLAAFINALQGTQYVFLLIFSIFLSIKFPQILKEEISRGVILQKITAILVIGAGLFALINH